METPHPSSCLVTDLTELLQYVLISCQSLSATGLHSADTTATTADTVAALLYSVRLGSNGQPDFSTAITRQRANTGVSRITSIAALGDKGDLVVCGITSGTFTDSKSSPAPVASGGNDIFVSRYDTSLNEIWTVQVCHWLMSVIPYQL